jgi:hypothetical protein
MRKVSEGLNVEVTQQQHDHEPLLVSSVVAAAAAAAAARGRRCHSILVTNDRGFLGLKSGYRALRIRSGGGIAARRGSACQAGACAACRVRGLGMLRPPWSSKRAFDSDSSHSAARFLDDSDTAGIG